jgi:hypothetical protein
MQFIDFGCDTNYAFSFGETFSKKFVTKLFLDDEEAWLLQGFSVDSAVQMEDGMKQYEFDCKILILIF